jgi:hypothetical protein
MTWRQDSAYNLLTGKRHEAGPTNLPPSTVDGYIIVNGAKRSWFSRFILSSGGYATTYGIYHEGKLELSQRIRPPPLPQDRFVLDYPIVNSGISNGYFLVPMSRSSNQ